MLAMFLALSLCAEARETNPGLESLRAEAMERYRRDDAAGFVERMEVVAASSRDETDLYNLACGYALAGRPEEALAVLRGLSDRGASFDLLGDSDFDSVRDRPEFIELASRSKYYEEVNTRLEPVRDQAMEQYKEGRYEAFVHIMEPIATYSRNERDIYNLACGYALTGRRDEAIAQLQILAERGTDLDIANDEDFVTLRGDPRFRDILVRLGPAR